VGAEGWVDVYAERRVDGYEGWGRKAGVTGVEGVRGGEAFAERAAAREPFKVRENGFNRAESDSDGAS
jgi:hypothetical protein